MDWQNPYDRDEGRGFQHGWDYGDDRDEDIEKKMARDIRTCFSRTGFVYVAFLILSIASQWLALTVLERSGLADDMDWNLYMLIAMFSMYPAAVPLTGLLMKWVPSAGGTGHERWGIGKLAGFFVFSMGILYAGNLVGLALTGAAGMIKGEPIVNDMQEVIMSMDTGAIMLSAVIVAPIMEELVFRKFLLDRIAGYGHWTAMVVSGVIFGVAHGNFYQFFYAFGLGMIFAYIYLRTGRIAYTAGFHMLINFCGSILPLGLLKIAQINAVMGGILAIGNMMLMFGFMICALVLFLCCRQNLQFDRGIQGLSSRRKNRAVWINVGMVLFLVWGAVTLARSL